jgi:hypothetical protein
VRKCYARHDSADDVAIFLRDEGAQNLVVLPPAPGTGWVAVLNDDGGGLGGHAKQLAERFGAALVVDADDAGWLLEVVRPGGETLTIDSQTVSKDDSRKAAQSVAQALSAPKITTALARVLSRPQGGAAALERLGEALGLAACARRYQEVLDDARQDKLRVDGPKVVGRVTGAAAGAGYAHVSALVEDMVVDLLSRGRYEAALIQLKAYDVILSSEDGAMRCRAPQGMVTPALRQAFGEHKEAILRLLDYRQPS